MIRKNVFIFHANLVELTLEGRLITNKVVKPLIVKMCFHCKFFILVLKIQGDTCSPTSLYATFIDFGCGEDLQKPTHEHATIENATTKP